MQAIINTERLVLRPFKQSDAKRVAQLAGDKRISEMTKNIPYPYSEDMAIEWIATHPAQFASGHSVVYAITTIECDDVIGTLGFVDINEGVGTLGYWLGVDFWGQGFAPEAVKGLVHYYQNEKGLKGLEATHFVENSRSRAVIEKLGLQYVEDTQIEVRGEQRTISVHRVRF
ncbi:GNAT family N-acetyltransferase [Pseudoalteromonas sp. JBTF-M23]|uniref:GNAT family N-acetyltransferase n=1 Tax=Pseudoalteromonas caenipelagi TaxID=2726988 RepID=A0A849VK47_9GAMM|nr:GNAT family N-acetyltransferase [Pseudoalteromonas caenipelagi]NOU52164.1 GNAT family N-acetyltransferase [Pseudoalteromonas caenipelagi]